MTDKRPFQHLSEAALSSKETYLAHRLRQWVKHLRQVNPKFDSILTEALLVDDEIEERGNDQRD